MKTKELLGARIKEMRKAKGLTQDQLSEIVGIDPKHLSRIEVGRNYPSLDALKRMAAALHVEIRDFFEFEHQEKNLKEIKGRVDILLKEAGSDKLRLILKLIRAVVR